jgi:lysophospholipid acyltransferase (LPLAT)-like uncharacterized protein
VVLAFWHEYNLVAATAAHRLRGHQHHVSFSTRTFRGEVMTAMLAALDAGSVSLPAEGERAEAAGLAREMARLGREGESLVVSPDGPVGPYRRAKPGALIVARASGLPLQPWAVAVRPAIRMRGRWDRHIVPLPFCRLRVEQADPIRVGPREPLRPLLARLQAALDDAASRASGSRRLGPANRARIAGLRRQSRPRPLTDSGRLVLLAGLCVLIGALVLAWLTHPDPPRRNELGLVPQVVVWLFVAASGAILAGKAWGPRPSRWRALGWIIALLLAASATAFLATPHATRPWLLVVFGALPAAIRDSSFFRETGTYLLAGLIWSPYVMWLYIGGVYTVRLLRAAAGWGLTRIRAR